MLSSKLDEGSSTPQPRSRSQSQASSHNNAQDGSDAPDGEERKADALSQEMLDQDERLKKNYEEFNEVIKAHQTDEIKTLTRKEERTTTQKVCSNVGDLLTGTVLKSDLNRLKHLKCVESIEFSGFNPVPEHRQMAGDIFYLTVKTLENPSLEHVITCSVNGFYRNDSSERVTLNPMPSQRTSPCFSYTLAGCLNQLSPAFSKNLQTYLGSILRTEPYFISPIAQPVHHWIVDDTK